MAGRGSHDGLLPYGDANAIVMEMAQEVLPVEHTPVLAGVCGTDPSVLWKYSEKAKKPALPVCKTFPRGLIDGVFVRTWKRPVWLTRSGNGPDCPRPGPAYLYHVFNTVKPAPWPKPAQMYIVWVSPLVPLVPIQLLH